MNEARTYKLKHKMIVYGGHDTWLKSIQPLMKNVKFIYKDMKPKTEQMRNADMIWVQTNCICHPFYYKIKKIASLYKIPLHHFSYVSAIKCAEQMVAADISSQ